MLGMNKTSLINSSRRLVLGTVLTMAALASTGCVQLKSYVDPKLPRASLNDLHPSASPQPLQLAFEFQVNGKSHPSIARKHRPQVVRVLSDSKLFSTISSSNSTETAQLQIVMNDQADIGDAVGKGLMTGLTFGGAGSLVTDGFLFTASYTAPGKAPVTKTYQHALHSTIGNKKGPEGLEPKSLNDAFAEVLEQLMLNLLRDLQNDAAL